MANQWRENGHFTEVANLMEGEWSCYRCGKFMAGEWSCFRGGHFNGGRMVMLQVVTLLEGEWSCYGCGQFYGGRIVILHRCSF